MGDIATLYEAPKPKHDLAAMAPSDQRALIRFEMRVGRDTLEIAERHYLPEYHIWNILAGGDPIRNRIGGARS
jgi:hypothetical protein